MPRTYIIIAGIALILLGFTSQAPCETADGPMDGVTLDGALSLALANNLELQAAAEGVAAARWGIKAAKALNLFSLSGAASTSKTGPEVAIDIPGQGEIPIRPGNWQSALSMTLSQPIFTFGLNKNIIKIAELGFDGALAEYEIKLDDIQYRVESSYYDLVQLEMLLDVQEQNLQRAENDKRIAELRYDAGQVARFEVIRADVAVKNAEEQLIGTRKNLDVARLGWQRLLGIEEFMGPVTIDPADVEPIPLAFTVEDAQDVALRMRPELAGMKAAIKTAERGAALKSLRPDLRFIGSYNLSNTSTAFSSNEDWRLMFNLNIPLWDGGKANAEVAQGMHQAEQLRITLADLERIVKIEVSEAYLAVSESIERMSATSATLALAEEAKRMAEIGYSQGVVTLQEVLSAEVDLSGAKVNRIGAVYGYLKAKAKLRKAIGTDALPGEG